MCVYFCTLCQREGVHVRSAYAKAAETGNRRQKEVTTTGYKTIATFSGFEYSASVFKANYY